MIRSIALAAAVTALAIPVSTSAADVDPAFDAFQSICWNSGGDYVAAVKAAETAGWTKADVVADDDTSVSITDKDARELVVPGGRLTLLETRGLRHMKSGSDMKVTTCKLTINKADPALIPAANTWVGSAPDAGDPTLAIFYVGAGARAGKPQHVGQSGASTAIDAGGLNILKFQEDPGAGIIVQQTYTK